MAALGMRSLPSSLSLSSSLCESDTVRPMCRTWKAYSKSERTSET